MGKSRKTALAAKIEKNALLSAPCFAKSRFSGDFGAPAGRHFEPKSVVLAKGGQHFWVTKTRADDGSLPRALPEPFWRLRAPSGSNFQSIFKRIYNYFLVEILIEKQSKNPLRRASKCGKATAKLLKKTCKHSGQPHPQGQPSWGAAVSR